MFKKDKKSVFLSYSHSDPDAKWTERLAKELKTSGVNCWVDKDDIKPGEDWQLAMQHALDESSVCMVILSNASVASQPKLSREWSAIQESAWQKDLTVCSLVIGDTQIPPFLKKWQSISVDKSDDWGKIVYKTTSLLEEIQATPLDSKVNKESVETAQRFKELIEAIETEKNKNIV